MIQLTDENGDKFYVNELLIERIRPAQYRGGSQIQLTSGRWLECIEGAEEIIRRIEYNDKEDSSWRGRP